MRALRYKHLRRRPLRLRPFLLLFSDWRTCSSPQEKQQIEAGSHPPWILWHAWTPVKRGDADVFTYEPIDESTLCEYQAWALTLAGICNNGSTLLTPTAIRHLQLHGPSLVGRRHRRTGRLHSREGLHQSAHRGRRTTSCARGNRLSHHQDGPGHEDQHPPFEIRRGHQDDLVGATAGRARCSSPCWRRRCSSSPSLSARSVTSDRHSTLPPKGTVRNGGARQRQRPDWRPGSGPSTPF